MITVTEICKFNRDGQVNFFLRERDVNPGFIVSSVEDHTMKDNLENGYLPEGLDGNHSFTRLILAKGMSGFEMTVVGNLDEIRKLITKDSNKFLLKG